MPTLKVSAEIIHAAIEGYESHKKRIDAQIVELRQMLAGASEEPVGVPDASSRTGTRSAAVRQKMAAAQKRRWAKIKGAPVDGLPAAAAKPKRQLSAAGRKNIIEATKKR